MAIGQRYAADASIIAADANRQQSTPKADWKPEAIEPNEAPCAVREYLETLDGTAFGAASTVTPKFVSHSDPASQWTGALGGPAYFACSTNYLIDTDNAVILDVEPARSIRQAEVGAVRTMIDRVHERHELKPGCLIADTAYGSGPVLDWLVEKRGNAPHIPVMGKSGRKEGTFGRADFTYDAGNDLYICPGGKELKQYRRACKAPRMSANKDGTVDEPFDLLQDYCTQIPVMTICRLLGVQEHMAPQLLDWSHTMVARRSQPRPSRVDSPQRI